MPSASEARVDYHAVPTADAASASASAFSSSSSPPSAALPARRRGGGGGAAAAAAADWRRTLSVKVQAALWVAAGLLTAVYARVFQTMWEPGRSNP